MNAARPPKIAFVLGGGGVLGAHEVGMLRALADRGIAPGVAWYVGGGA
jgi:NTE family protein